MIARYRSNLSVVAAVVGHVLVGAAVSASIASAALDFLELVVRLRNVGARRDVSLANLAGAFASTIDLTAKAIIIAGLTGGGPVVTGVGLGLAVTADAVKVVLLHTNSLREYRSLLLTIADSVRSLVARVP